MKQSASVTMNSCRSGCKLRGIVSTFCAGKFGRGTFGGRMFEFRYEFFEPPPAVLVILKLVETGARRREQNGIAKPGALAHHLDCAFHRTGMHDGNRIAKLRCDFFCCCADQQDEAGTLAKG